MIRPAGLTVLLPPATRTGVVMDAWIFELVVCFLQRAALSSATRALRPEFDLSQNDLTGLVPAFLANSQVPTSTRPTISLLVMIPCYFKSALLSLKVRFGLLNALNRTYLLTGHD